VLIGVGDGRRDLNGRRFGRVRSFGWCGAAGRNAIVGDVASHVISVEREQGAVVCANCVLADTPWTRLRGLLGRTGLEADEGLLLRPVASIHTFFMRFPIDVVFLDRGYAVIKVVREVRPWRFAAARRAKVVLELPAGAAARARLAVGDRLVPVPKSKEEAA
jgi:uncharacterized protein